MQQNNNSRGFISPVVLVVLGIIVLVVLGYMLFSYKQVSERTASTVEMTQRTTEMQSDYAPMPKQEGLPKEIDDSSVEELDSMMMELDSLDTLNLEGIDL